MVGCDAWPADHAAVMTIIRPDETGISLTLDVTVQDVSTRKPIPGATIFMYQTNSKGENERDNNGIARISGTVESDEQGKIRFVTIYPRGYDDSPTGEHMHFQANAQGFARSVANLIFADYYHNRYDWENPYTYKVYLQTLGKSNGTYRGEAVLLMKKQ
jgi:protocatechuate 3,4-dioxygenase beta subunit